MPPKKSKPEIGRGKRHQGRKEFLEFKKGNKIPASAAIKAYCYTCMSEYDDGAGDCGDENCPLHPFMPYNKNRAPRRVLKPEHIEKLKKKRVTKNEIQK